ncbi:MAG: hypothetical protein HQM09_08440 [Candidatus Riflebacteria bacterium]|nr:hypothetical protein [Candidatus Riflebacteria bacterium]
MKKAIWLLMSVILLGMYGCRTLDRQNEIEPSGSLPTAADTQTVPEGRASLTFDFVIPGAHGRKTDIRSLISGSTVSVTFVLKLVNDGNITRPYIELRKEIPVINGTAAGSFTNLPPHSLVAEVLINGGNKSGFASFHGAIDLENGSNTVAVAPVGSKEEPDLLAKAIDELNSCAEYIAYVKPKLACLVKNAITTSTGIVGSASTRLLENIREVYLAQNTASGTSQANPYVDSTQKYISSYWQYKGKTLQASPSASIRRDIRAEVGYWSWDWYYMLWYIDIPGAGQYSRYAYYFSDPYGYHYTSIYDSIYIDRLVTGSIINYAADYWGFTTLTLSEYYVYLFLDGFLQGTNFMVRIGGYADAVYNTVLGSQQIYRVDSDVQADVRENYPATGTIIIQTNTGGKATVSFNGTCVANVAISYQGGASESFRLLLGGPNAQ